MHDITVFGATGFTGRRLAHKLCQTAPPTMNIALAGRDQQRLEALAQSVNRRVDLIVADINDPKSVATMTEGTDVLVSTVGPFAKYGTPVVKACIDSKTNYLDITGETPWAAEMVERFHEQAKADGTLLVPFSGYDSVPSDLGVLMMANHFRREFDEGLADVRVCFAANGGFNGGTIASALELGSSGSVELARNPLVLNPNGKPLPGDGINDPNQPFYSEDEKRWWAPNFMGPVNTRVVRRSRSLFDHEGFSYGERINYLEYMKITRRASRLTSSLVAGGLGLFEKALTTQTGRRIIDSITPAPGEGPSEATIENGFFRARFYTTSESGRKAVGTVSAKGDPGNEVTVTCLAESALATAVGQTRNPIDPGHGGVLTPAFAFGEKLQERLTKRGFIFSIDSNQ